MSLSLPELIACLGPKRHLQHLQHPSSKTDRDSVAHGRVYLKSTRHHFQHLEGVSRAFHWCKPSIADTISRYVNAEVALNTGVILREILRYEPLARILLYSDQSVPGIPAQSQLPSVRSSSSADGDSDSTHSPFTSKTPPSDFLAMRSAT